MSTFSIDPDNNITALIEVPADADRSNTFSTEREFAKLVAEWPVSRLIDAWNSFAGVAPFQDLKPIRKFTDRKVAIARIWAAIQRLSADGAQPAHDVTPEPARSKKSATKAPRRARAKHSANGAEERTNKKAEVLAMMKRAKGATLAEIMEATSWQAHTVRGFVSILGSKGGVKVESLKNADGERTYRVAK
jgi:Protein of unknown function (DUF3489)